MKQSNSILVRHYLIPSGVHFQRRLQICRAVLQTKIVDICIDFYPCNFLCSDLLVIYHIIVNFHPVYLILKDRDVSFVWRSGVVHSVFSDGFDWFDGCRMCHVLLRFLPHSTLVFTAYVYSKFAPDYPKLSCLFAIPVSKMHIFKPWCMCREFNFRRRHGRNIPVPVSSDHLDLVF